MNQTPRSRRSIALACCAVPLLLTAPAHAATYKVASATHTSTSTKSVTGYSGTSTATWKLRTPTRRIANTIEIGGRGASASGMGAFAILGSYRVDITTTFPGRCAWSATTGDGRHPASAPGPVDLLVAPDPRAPGRLRVSYTGARASLSNMYLGTECSTGVSGEPRPEVTQSRSVSPGLFKKRTVALSFAGTTTADDITYRWTTRLVLKRAR